MKNLVYFVSLSAVIFASANASARATTENPLRVGGNETYGKVIQLQGLVAKDLYNSMNAAVTLSNFDTQGIEHVKKTGSLSCSYTDGFWQSLDQAPDEAYVTCEQKFADTQIIHCGGGDQVAILTAMGGMYIAEVDGLFLTFITDGYSYYESASKSKMDILPGAGTNEVKVFVDNVQLQSCKIVNPK